MGFPEIPSDIPQEIAKYLTDDPDIFYEMATTSAGVAGTDAAFADPGLATIHKDMPKQRSRKKPPVNQTTGKPTDDKKKVLFGDVPTENPEEPIEEESDRDRWRRESRERREAEVERKKIEQHTANFLAVDRATFQLPVRYLKGHYPLKGVRSKIKFGLASAETAVRSIRNSLKELGTVYSYNMTGCKLIEDWVNLEGEAEELGKGAKAVRYDSIPPGWWDTEDWSSTSMKKEYWVTFFREVCVMYLEKAQEHFRKHQSRCGYPDLCSEKKHFPFLVGLFCKGKGTPAAMNRKGVEVEELSLDAIWTNHQQARNEAFKKHREERRASRKKAEEPPPPKFKPLNPEEQRNWDWYKLGGSTPPGFPTPPEGLTGAQRRAWIRDNVSHRKMFPSVLDRTKPQPQKSTTKRDEQQASLLDLDFREMKKGEVYWWHDGGINVRVMETSGEGVETVSVCSDDNFTQKNKDSQAGAHTYPPINEWLPPVSKTRLQDLGLSFDSHLTASLSRIGQTL